jgi:hypothetical protein
MTCGTIDFQKHYGTTCGTKDFQKHYGTTCGTIDFQKHYGTTCGTKDLQTTETVNVVIFLTSLCFKELPDFY